MIVIERPRSINIGSKQMQVPAYFPSISSVKTPMPPAEYLSVLTALEGLNDKYLVSAYDIFPLKDEKYVRDCIAAARVAGRIVLMDSGNYESFWKENQDRWKQEDFHSTLDTFSCDLAFGFDEQQPPENEDEHVDLVIKRWELDQRRAGNCRIVPIVHGSAKTLPSLCRKVAERSGVDFIAVAERRLGDGLIDRARTVGAIRESLDCLDRYVFLHLLGTGNPISMAVFSLQGADSFDGLEWCQTVVDHESALLFHISQADFFIGQTDWSEADVPFQMKALAHNLEFYRDWMARLQRAHTRELHIEFCKLNFPERIFRICAVSLGWVKS